MLKLNKYAKQSINQAKHLVRLTINVLNWILLTVILSMVMLSLQVQIQPILHQRWELKFFLQYIRVDTVHLLLLGYRRFLIQAVVSSVAATYGFNTTHKYGWFLLMPWLMKTICFWFQRLFEVINQFLVTTAPNSTEILHLLIIHLVLSVLIIHGFAQFTLIRFKAMQIMDKELNEYEAWKQINKHVITPHNYQSKKND